MRILHKPILCSALGYTPVLQFYLKLMESQGHILNEYIITSLG